MNKGSDGPHLIDSFEVPEIIKKVLQYVREPKLAILEYVKLQKPLKNTKFQQSPKVFAVFLGL